MIVDAIHFGISFFSAFGFGFTLGLVKGPLLLFGVVGVVVVAVVAIVGVAIVGGAIAERAMAHRWCSDRGCCDS